MLNWGDVKKQLGGSLHVFRRGLLWTLVLFCLSAVTASENVFTLPPEIFAAVEKQYGRDAGSRLAAWQELIRNNGGGSDGEKLKMVNSFFNRMEFVDDVLHWQKKDYWATPVEFLATNGGDCEDFSLAKYFTLKAMGVAESKLNLTYVKALRLNQAHMVLTYHEKPTSEPLVLDNLIPQIRPASERRDLLPVYSFNGAGLWLAKTRGRGQRVGGSDRLKRWKDLLQRLPKGL